MKLSLLSKIRGLLKGEDKTPLQNTTEIPTNVFDEYRASRSIPKSGPLCLAPWVSISFGIDGYATVCCLNRKTTVSMEHHTIDDIWKSEAFQQLRENVSENDLGYDCSICKNQIEAKNFTGVKSADYDNYYPYNPERPAIMEFCLENTCNLACVMCNSLLSSTIRKNEQLPPLKKFYGDEFVEQLEDYIPYLKEAVFAGGEPFLIPIYYKIWEKMLAINPTMTIGIVTNGSTLNSRIKDLLEKGRFRINISIDSVDKETYEGIRRNANFETLMNNFEWLKEYGERKGLPVNIPVCPLTDNWEKIPEIVRFANAHNVSLNFVYVDRPFSLSLTYGKPEFFDNIIKQYTLEEFERNSSMAAVNIRRFKGLIEDVRKWKENSIQTPSSASLQGDLLQLLEMKILESTEIPDDSSGLTKREMISKIKNLLQELPVEQRDMILNVLHRYAVERLYHFLEAKSIQEIIVFLKEYVGPQREG